MESASMRRRCSVVIARQNMEKGQHMYPPKKESNVSKGGAGTRKRYRHSERTYHAGEPGAPLPRRDTAGPPRVRGLPDNTPTTRQAGTDATAVKRHTHSLSSFPDASPTGAAGSEQNSHKGTSTWYACLIVSSHSRRYLATQGSQDFGLGDLGSKGHRDLMTRQPWRQG
jgi:hypothetical protein